MRELARCDEDRDWCPSRERLKRRWLGGVVDLVCFLEPGECAAKHSNLRREGMEFKDNLERFGTACLARLSLVSTNS